MKNKYIDKKYNYVYKITNLLNNKIYIGVHSTNNLETDHHMGSGRQILEAIKKYGVKNFKKDIIQIFDNVEDAYALEKELVNEDFVKLSNNYNIMIGGNSKPYYSNNETKSQKLSEKAKNMVMAIDLRTNQTCKVSKQIFDSDKNLVGITYNKAIMKDSEGNPIVVDKDDQNFQTYQGYTKGYSIFKDSSGNHIFTTVDDPRVLSGQLVGITSGCKQTEESNKKRSATQKGRHCPICTIKSSARIAEN